MVWSKKKSFMANFAGCNWRRSDGRKCRIQETERKLRCKNWHGRPYSWRSPESYTRWCSWGSHLAGGQRGGGRQRSRDSPFRFNFNLQEKTPLVLAMISIITIIMAITSNQGWNYMMRSSTIKSSDGGSPYPGMGEHRALVLQFEAMYHGRSLQLIERILCGKSWEFSILRTHAPNFFSGSYSYCITARVFGSLSVILAFYGISLVSIATWTKLKTRTRLFICALFLIVITLARLQLLFLKSNLCNVWLFQGTEDMITSQCKLSTDGAIGVAATVLWFIIAAGCCHKARRSK